MKPAQFRNCVSRALEGLGHHLAAYVASQKEVRPDRPGSTDTQKALEAIFEDWNRLGRAFDKSIRNRRHELQGLRNKLAHYEPLAWDDAYRTIESTIQVLAAIGAPAQPGLEEDRRLLLSSPSTREPARPAVRSELIVAIIACT